MLILSNLRCKAKKPQRKTPIRQAYTIPVIKVQTDNYKPIYKPIKKKKR